MSSGSPGPKGWKEPVETKVENRTVAFTEQQTIVSTVKPGVNTDGKRIVKVVTIDAQTGDVLKAETYVK